MTAFDTDVLSDLLAGSPAYLARASLIPPADQRVPVVAAAEVMRGWLAAIRQAEAGRGQISLSLAYDLFAQRMGRLNALQTLPYAPGRRHALRPLAGGQNPGRHQRPPHRGHLFRPRGNACHPQPPGLRTGARTRPGGVAVTPLLVALALAAPPAAVPLATVAEPPAVQVLAPGFAVRELPVGLTNVNTVCYAPDGRLLAAGYDGRSHLLRDTDGDGLEDRVVTFHDKKSDDYPLGAAYHNGAFYVTRRHHVARHPDGPGGVPGPEEVAATGRSSATFTVKPERGEWLPFTVAVPTGRDSPSVLTVSWSTTEDPNTGRPLPLRRVLLPWAVPAGAAPAPKPVPELADGRTLTGVTNGSTEAAVTVTDQTGKPVSVPRADVVGLTPAKTSVMPDGLLDGLTPAQVRDLMTFLLTDPPPAKGTP